MTNLKALALAGTILSAPFFAQAASAASIVALVDGKTLVMVDPAGKKAGAKVDIKGATNVAGIDVRPADGMLYAVTADGNIYTVDAKTGQATMKSTVAPYKASSTAASCRTLRDLYRVPPSPEP